MKDEKISYFNNSKGKIKQKYILLYFEIIIILLKIDLVNLITLKNTRRLNYYDSEIKLVIQVFGYEPYSWESEKYSINILNNEFYPEPSVVKVNGVKIDYCRKTCYLKKKTYNVTLIFNDQIEICSKMFYGMKNIIEADLSKFDASMVVNISYMFEDCYNLKKINFGNINTFSVENMEGLFAYCTSLTSIDLSSFDTSNVETMEKMFYYCKSLKYLNLSNFDTSKVTTISEMFYYCSSLIYLNLYQFQMNSSVNKNYAFYKISENVKYCINDTETKNYLLGNNIISICSDTCYNESNLKGDSVNYKCIESCQIIQYDYEYNSICYEKCPNGTLLNGRLCKDYKCVYNLYHYCGSYYYCDCGFYYDFSCCSYFCNYHDPEGYYFDSEDEIYKKCYEKCKICNGKGNETINNCKECIFGYTFLNETKNKTNCYKKCDYYYYYESDEYHCTDNLKCPENYSKLIENQKICIDKCKNDDIYKYEYNGTCYQICPGETYIIDDKDDNLCYNKTPVGYYLDIKNQTYKKCYERCDICDKKGNETNHNCIKCKDDYSFYNNSIGITNCYPKCNYYYYYFDEFDNYHCNKTCPEEYKSIPNKYKCIDDCKKDDTYQYEYNNTCYDECPYDTYLLEDNNDNMCYDHLPDGYYLDKENHKYKYKKCYKTCKKCNIGGNITNNNCLECKYNFTSYKNITNISNCYPTCNNYYYFDESNKFHCVEICQGNYNKKIIDKKICIDDCKKDDTYKYEYNNTCYKDCPDDTYVLEYNNDNICYNKTPEHYYLDLGNKIFKKCYNICNSCDKGGSEINHNCIKCKSGYDKYENPMNISNCYPTCNYYYFFDSSNNFICTQNFTCPNDFPYLIQGKKQCVKYKIMENTFILDEISTTIKEAKDERDEEIDRFRKNLDDFNVSENKDIIKTEGNVQYQMTTSDNQKNNSNKNMSTIDLGMCEDKLKTIYGIDKSLPLIIFKIDYFSPDTLIPIIGYEIYHPLNKSKLDLKYCEDILIKLNIPVTIDENNLFKYDPNSEYYNDNCFSYTTENGTDIILNDRKQEFVDNNLSLCENNCNYTGYIKEDKQSSCNCVIKNKMDLISEIIENPNKLSNNFATDESSSSSGSSNIVSIKCTKALFSKEGLKNNISSYILLIFIGQFLLSIILFMKCGYPLLVNNINEIINEKEKIQKEFTLGNQAILPQKRKRKKKKKKSGRKKKVNYPPKKYSLNFFNNNLNLSKINNNNINKRNKKNLDTDLIDENNNKNKNDSSIQKIISKIKIVYTDYELNNFEYKYAILHDKRSFGEYYCSLIKEKNIILFSFCPRKDYNSIIIRSSIFSLSFSIYYAVNFAFFTDEILHKIYEDGGKYDVLYFLPEIIISFVISYYLTAIIKLIFLSERNIAKVRQQSSLSKAYYFSEKARKNLVIKYIIYFILGLGFLFLFWMLLSSFGAVYPNTQMFIFKNALISFAMALVYPFFIYIFPCVLRMCSLNSSQKDNECVYKISKLLQMF